PTGFGLSCATHFVPFHRSIKRVAVPEESCVPTATHAEGVGHDTAARWPYAAPAAVGTTVQRAAAAPAGPPTNEAAASAAAAPSAPPTRRITRRAPRG